MRSLLWTLTVAVLSWAPLACAQEAEETDSMADRTPTENASRGSVRDRAPGTWITAARERHQTINNARVNAARGGERAGTFDGYDTDGETTTSDSSSSGGLSDLLDLLNQLGGIGSIGDLEDLLGNLTGGSSSTTIGGSSTTGGTMTIEDLLRLEEQLLGGSSSSSSSKSSSRAQSLETRDGSGAIGRLPKIESRAQTSDDDRKFVARWAESMVDTFFTALAVGMQSRDFINFLEDQLRPIFFPSSTDDDSDESSGSGGGIEDLNPTDGGSGSDSVI